MSPAALRTLKEVARRGKGWPIGVPCDDRSGKALVKAGYLEWAPPAYVYPRPMRTYRLTTLGKLVVEGRVSS